MTQLHRPPTGVRCPSLTSALPQHHYPGGGGTSSAKVDTARLPPPTLGYDFAGYYPKRHDFEQEYNDSCESLISGIVFYDDDECVPPTPTL